MPDIIEDHRFDARLEHGKSKSKVPRSLAHVNGLQPVCTMQRPVSVEERGTYRTLQRCEAHAQRRHDESCTSVDIARPLELAGRREGEFVREIAASIAVLVMLVFVESHVVRRVLIHIVLEAALLTCKNRSIECYY